LAFIGLPFSPFFIGFPPKKVNGTRKLMKGRKSNTFDFLFHSFALVRGILAKIWQRCATWQRSALKNVRNVATLDVFFLNRMNLQSIWL
jgi:hypothetical protein